jgi:hypothetical protein
LQFKKKPVTAFRAGNGFFAFWLLVRLGHYQPLVIIADDNPGDDDNKANKVDNGDAMSHARTNFFLTFRQANSRQ